MIAGLDLENPFWRFSLKVYAAPGVEPGCLGLQRELGIDVNLLLFCAWRGAQSHLLSADEFQRIKETVRVWQQEVVLPLRHARKHLKGSADADEATFLRLRKDMGGIELRAEQIEQAILFAQVKQSKPETGAGAEAVRKNIDLYLVPFGRTHEAASFLDDAVTRVIAGT